MDKTTEKKTHVITNWNNFDKIFCNHIISDLNNKQTHPHHLSSLSLPHLPPLTPFSSGPSLLLQFFLFLPPSVSGGLAWTFVSLSLQAFSCLVIYFLHFIAESRGMFYRIGHLIMGERKYWGMARQFLSVLSLSAVSLNLKRKEEKEKKTDAKRQILFAQQKCLWLTGKYLFLY